MKRLFNLFLAVVMIFSFTCIQVYAANGTGGSGNIDGGGGSMGDATSHGSWNPGNEGVRVTVVRASDHAVVTTPFDLTNKTPSAGIYHFGKVSKIQYNNGMGTKNAPSSTRLPRRKSSAGTTSPALMPGRKEKRSSSSLDTMPERSAVCSTPFLMTFRIKNTRRNIP